MNVIELLKNCGLNRFLYINSELILDSGYGDKNKSFIISLQLDIKRISFIKENYDSFIKILENILYTFNQKSEIKYKNISFTNIKFSDKLINNCIFLYDSKNEFTGYTNIKGLVKFSKININTNLLTMKDKILNLAENNSLSIRNLIKLGLNQTRARNLYNYFKDEKIIEISKYNNMSKKINIDKLKKILNK